jgi:hypothetical protein
MKWEDVIKGLVRTAGKSGVDALEAALERIEKEVDEPWKKTVLNMVGDAVEKYGMDGVGYVEKLIDRIGEDEEPDLRFASLKARSDYLAVLQNLEADRKSKARDMIRVIGKQLGEILKAILAGLAG